MISLLIKKVIGYNSKRYSSRFIHQILIIYIYYCETVCLTLGIENKYQRSK